MPTTDNIVEIFDDENDSTDEAEESSDDAEDTGDDVPTIGGTIVEFGEPDSEKIMEIDFDVEDEDNTVAL